MHCLLLRRRPPQLQSTRREKAVPPKWPLVPEKDPFLDSMCVPWRLMLARCCCCCLCFLVCALRSLAIAPWNSCTSGPFATDPPSFPSYPATGLSSLLLVTRPETGHARRRCYRDYSRRHPWTLQNHGKMGARIRESYGSHHRCHDDWGTFEQSMETGRWEAWQS